MNVWPKTGFWTFATPSLLMLGLLCMFDLPKAQ
jgi:hypothetical protein